MIRRLPIEFSNSAAAQIRMASEWWKRNRPAAPHAIAEELEKALELISMQPSAGALAHNTRLSGVRRVRLGRVGYYLYYRPTNKSVQVLSMWHMSRGSDPST